MKRTNFISFKVLFFFLLSFTFPNAATLVYGQDSFVYNNQPLKKVFEDIEERVGYRFLYRDALISGKRITLQAEPDSLISFLKKSLLSQQLDLKIDHTHKQILLSEAHAQTIFQPSIIKGQVLDGDSGTRLPFANITWINDGNLEGVSTNEAGFFHIRIDERTAENENLTLAISYVGYRPSLVTLDLDNPPTELSIRLSPQRIHGQEVLVQSSVLHTDLDTTWHQLLYAGLFSPFGESSILRSLQPLPAVSISTAVSEGLNVRGSKADGFQVLLDGAPIYNQNHFFGMFDVFNEDALQTVGFYYDIAPASYFAPPGGTISFITRTGSLSDFEASVGASSTAFRGTFEGPLAKGKASWLVSGRHSYIDQIDWLNNQSLVGLGLNIDREIEDLPAAFSDYDEFVSRTMDTQARFYDIHSKISLETKRGGRSTLSLYAGGNNTQLDADRLVSGRRDDNGDVNLVFEPSQTKNKWGNEAASLQFNNPIGERSYLQSTLSVSHYLSSYRKDDLIYSRINPNTRRVTNFPFPFEYENELLDLKWSHQLSIAPGYPGLWSFGASGNYYALTYQEKSANRPFFGEDYFAIQGDAYGEYEFDESKYVNFRSGLRLHYFTQGHIFRLSPRLQLTLFPRAPVTLRAGYSRNYQFLHQLFLENTNSASMWVITTGSQGPSHVENYTAGLYLKPFRGSFLQVEGYIRTYGKLRRHEIVAPVRPPDPDIDSVNLVPWFSNSNAYAKGLEFMYNQKIGPATWTNSYTRSSIDLQNDLVLDGARYPAEWDRTHQFTSNLQIDFSSFLSANLTWYYASGKANTLAYNESEQESINLTVEEERLPDYHRLDASLKATINLKGNSRMEARFSVYNLYDQANVWYREPIQVFRSSRPASGPRFFNVDVFDLAMQPAFDISISF